MQNHKDIPDSAVAAMSEHICELLGVPCNAAVMAHWDTTEGQAALQTLLPQLKLFMARALTLDATKPLVLGKRAERAAQSFTGATRKPTPPISPPLKTMGTCDACNEPLGQPHKSDCATQLRTSLQ